MMLKVISGIQIFCGSFLPSVCKHSSAEFLDGSSEYNDGNVKRRASDGDLCRVEGHSIHPSHYRTSRYLTADLAPLIMKLNRWAGIFQETEKEQNHAEERKAIAPISEGKDPPTLLAGPAPGDLSNTEVSPPAAPHPFKPTCSEARLPPGVEAMRSQRHRASREFKGPAQGRTDLKNIKVSSFLREKLEVNREGDAGSVLHTEEALAENSVPRPKRFRKWAVDIAREEEARTQVDRRAYRGLCSWKVEGKSVASADPPRKDSGRSPSLQILHEAPSGLKAERRRERESFAAPQANVQTSSSHPLTVSWLSMNGSSLMGRVALSVCPGKKMGMGRDGTIYNRCIKTDVLNISRGLYSALNGKGRKALHTDRPPLASETITLGFHPSLLRLHSPLEGTESRLLVPATPPERKEDVSHPSSGLSPVRGEGGITQVVCLLSKAELATLGVDLLTYTRSCRAHGIEFLHFPLLEMAPFENFAELFRLCLSVVSHLSSSPACHTLIHCRGGIGRAGTLGACLLLVEGAGQRTASEVVAQVRRMRSKRAVESRKQEDCIKAFEAYLREHTPNICTEDCPVL